MDSETDKTIVVLSRQQAEAYEASDDYVVISIRWPGDQPARLRTDDHRLAALELEFDDTTDRNSKYPFDNGAADRILDFMEHHMAATEHVVVHCSAGISRSRGVALALAAIYRWNQDEHLTLGFANALVVHTMLERHAARTGTVRKMPEMPRLEIACDDHPSARIRREYDGEILTSGACYVCEKAASPKLKDAFAGWKVMGGR